MARVLVSSSTPARAAAVWAMPGKPRPVPPPVTSAVCPVSRSGLKTLIGGGGGCIVCLSHIAYRISPIAHPSLRTIRDMRYAGTSDAQSASDIPIPFKLGNDLQHHFIG